MLNELLQQHDDVLISGMLAPGFEAMLATFIDNFAHEREVGAGLCVYKDGQKVVELFGGYRDSRRTRAWHADTLVVTFSASKAPLYVLAILLAEEGLIEFDAPIMSYWPEFSSNGKHAITLRHILCHTAGLAAVAVPKGAATDWATMISALEAATPRTLPGERPTYHSLTQGWLLAQTFARASGKSFPELFVEKLQKPLSLDFHYGLSDAQIARCADYSFVPEPGYYYDRMSDERSIQAIALTPLGDNLDLNTERMRKSIIPAVKAMPVPRHSRDSSHP